MNRLQKRQWISLLLAAAVSALSLWASVSGGEQVRADDYDLKCCAARKMALCMESIRLYREEIHIPLSEGDTHRTGLIGEGYTGITTTLGPLEAKRTTANPDMAALSVQLLSEAGVRKGDTVGIGASGSFPSLVIGMLCAAEAMGVRSICIVSVGASTYGANQPGLTMPDMLCHLAEEGLIASFPAAVTPGGSGDLGNDMEPELLEAALERAARRGVPVWRTADYEENLAKRMALYQREGPIACFIGVGGNVTTMGRGGAELGQGVIRPYSVKSAGRDGGLVERYSARGVPVINLLNVKRLVADYGLAFDPEIPAEPGTSAVYFVRSEKRGAAMLGLVLSALILAAGFYKSKIN